MGQEGDLDRQWFARQGFFYRQHVCLKLQHACMHELVLFVTCGRHASSPTSLTRQGWWRGSLLFRGGSSKHVFLLVVVC